MAMIAVREDDPWVVARWAFERLIIAAAEEVADRPDLVERLRAAKALDGLSFSLLSEPDARTLGLALYAAAGRVASVEGARDDSISRSFVDALGDLRRRLDSALKIMEDRP